MLIISFKCIHNARFILVAIQSFVNFQIHLFKVPSKAKHKYALPESLETIQVKKKKKEQKQITLESTISLHHPYLIKINMTIVPQLYPQYVN